jgi:transposase-like protein/transposase Tn5 family protein
MGVPFRGGLYHRSNQRLVSPILWAKQVFGIADLGDKRRTRRLVEVAAGLAAKPSRRICGAFPQWSQIKGGYRLIENKAVTVEQLQVPSTQAAVEASAGEAMVLSVSDTTSFNFGNLRATSGLGPIGEEKTQGIHLHSTILLRPDGVPLGLLRQQVWARDPKEYGTRSKRKQRALEEKESFRWVQSVEESSVFFDILEEERCPVLVHISDRESDIHEVYQKVEEMGDECIIRACGDRGVDDPAKYLRDAVLRGKVWEHRTIDVPRKHGQKKRKARVAYRACTLTLNPPKGRPRGCCPVEVNVVAVTEVDPPDWVKEPLDWILVTTLTIDTIDEILEVVRLYTLRWRIEEFHLILKSGCGAEKLQFETAERLMKMLAILAAIAIRLLALTYQARVDPDLPCTEVLTEDEWRALVTSIQGRPPPQNARPPTLKQAVLWIGKLGGHVGRKSDGMPGVRVMWRGWQDLQLATTIYQSCMMNPHLGR